MFEKSVNAHRGHDDCRRASSTLRSVLVSPSTAPSISFSFRIDGPSDHFETVTHFLREDYTGLHELCDVNLRFNTDILPVHSVVLSANSTTLARKFRLANKCYDVDLSFLSKESVERILEYLYTGSVSTRGVSKELLISRSHSVSNLSTAISTPFPTWEFPSCKSRSRRNSSRSRLISAVSTC